ncbi:2,3-diaminopropionate biosynthesis protein SbnB [Candidatus Binatia bacterium]|nr:2,3-diaminopropionate biosynthesis protein SbnB [Candidatus Binatia bacterium]
MSALRYLGDADVASLAGDWSAAVATIEEAAATLAGGEFAQPLKLYLRFGDPRTRIIAMPAFIGGGIAAAGLKWVASFPDNPAAGLPRAHSVVIVNDVTTGAPRCIVNSPLLNGIRTAAVSALVLRRYLDARPRPKLTVGIIGWGPIGRCHAAMLASLLDDRVEALRLHDLQGVTAEFVPARLRDRTVVCESWQEVFERSDVTVTCTVARRRYIDTKPPRGALLLNVSLRDYHTSIRGHTDAIVVDDWREVCREDTDIERMHEECGLEEDDVMTIPELVRDGLGRFGVDEPILFCPMGMAVFDVALAARCWRAAELGGVGRVLE